MLWKENCCGSSVRCKTLVVVEAVVLCVLCVLVAMCGVVPVCCAASVAVRCCCCCCCCSGLVVVVGTRGGAGNVVGSSLSSRAVVGEVAAADTTAHSVANLEEDEDVVSTNPVVALVAETCLVEEVEEGNVEDPVAKAQAARC